MEAETSAASTSCGPAVRPSIVVLRECAAQTGDLAARRG